MGTVTELKEDPMGTVTELKPLNRTADNLTDWFDDKNPCHLALCWRRLGGAISAVHSATGTLDHEIIAMIDVLRDEAWSKLWDRTTGDERDKALAWAANFLEQS